MGKYINNGKGVLGVLGVKYKKGQTFNLTDEEEKKVSPSFLKQYSVDNNQKKNKAELRKEKEKAKTEAKEKSDADKKDKEVKEAEDKRKAESK